MSFRPLAIAALFLAAACADGLPDNRPGALHDSDNPASSAFLQITGEDSIATRRVPVGTIGECAAVAINAATASFNATVTCRDAEGLLVARFSCDRTFGENGSPDMVTCTRRGAKPVKLAV